MVWIHGGSLRNGSICLPAYAGHRFARDGVVLVSINYRLGIEGFGVFPDAPANLGLRDQIAALTWVRDNIAAFGGDPANVTVFGESAGVDLHRRAADQPATRRGCSSGRCCRAGPRPRSRPRPRAAPRRLIAKRLKVPATAAAFARVDRDRLLAAQVVVTRGGPPIGNGNGFTLAVDGDVLPRDPMVALHDGAAADIDRAAGLQRRGVPAVVRADRPGRPDQPAHAAAGPGRSSGCGRAPPRAYRAGPARRPSPGELLGAIATDRLLRRPLNLLADAGGRPATPGCTSSPGRPRWSGSAPATPWRSASSSTPSALPDARRLAGPNPPQELAAAMHAAWVSFAATGSTGWEAWNAERPVMTFAADGGDVVRAPREEERRLVAVSVRRSGGWAG